MDDYMYLSENMFVHWNAKNNIMIATNIDIPNLTRVKIDGNFFISGSTDIAMSTNIPDPDLVGIIANNMNIIGGISYYALLDKNRNILSTNLPTIVKNMYSVNRTLDITGQNYVIRDSNNGKTLISSVSLKNGANVTSGWLYISAYTRISGGFEWLNYLGVKI
jgi:hypothetical protein